VGQEFFINSQNLEDKIRKLLPSQGGAGAGYDLSASTQIIPIIDLTESAENSNLREDLQTSLSFTSITSFDVRNQTTVIMITREGSANGYNDSIQLTDGVTTKDVLSFREFGSATELKNVTPFDFIVFIGAGDSLQMVSGNNLSFIRGCTRQIADIDGNLVDPL
jgi:hypothetical protein